MRILKIKGANLASLAGPFELDLTAEPLKSAGLFAITGETGAGKSTLLDAMCLALYGDCPRLSTAGVNDDVPDVDGETIKSRDARAILRRGAATGFAEVQFQAPDGDSYSASWTVRRSRGKTDGRLQNVDRALTRLSDGQVLESQSMRVKERVEGLTGLTYDEFRRTVLLAQGDFDAFLRASTQERAGLLEKVTGTEIYRQISQRVYERFTVLRDALTRLEQRRADTSALTQSARAELSAEKTALVAEIQTLAATLKQVADKLQSHTALQAAKARVVAAEAAEQAARTAVGAAAPDRAQLAHLRQALDLRAEAARLTKAENALRQLTAQDSETRTRQADALTQAQAARTAHHHADQILIAAEKLFKDFGPAWTEATRLDGLQKSAMAERDQAKDTASKTRTLRDTAAAMLHGLEASALTTTQTRDAANACLLAQSDLRILAENWPRACDLINQRIAETSAMTAAKAAQETAQTRAATLEGEAAEMDTALTAEKATLADCEARLDTNQAALNDIQSQNPRATLEQLLVVISGLGDMMRAAEGRALAQDQHSKAIADHAATSETLTHAQTGATGLLTRVAQAEATVRALVQPVERAELAAGDMAQTLRERLEPGKPCMVCGATDHPVHGDDALAALARDLRADLDAARTAQDAARASHDAALRAITSHEHRLARLAEDRTTAADSMASFTAQFNQARAAVIAAGIEVPSRIDAPLAPLLDREKARRAAIDSLIHDERRLEDAIALDRKLAKTCATAIESIRAAMDEKRRAAASARADAALNQHTQDVAKNRLQTIMAALSPLVTGAKLPLAEVENSPQTARDRFAALVDDWLAQVQTRDAAAARLTDLAPQLSAAKADLRAAEASFADASSQTAKRQSELDALFTARAQLLGGEDTETHRSRHNQSRLDAQMQKDQLGAVSSAATARLSGIEAELAALTTALDPAREEAQTARDDLDQKLTAQGLTRDSLTRLLALGQAEIDRLTSALKAADDALTGAISALKARNADLSQIAAQGLPEESAEDLLALQTTVEVARTEKQERSGAITQTLAADDQVQAGLTTLDAEIRTAKALADTWAAVNDAVGSKLGGKFSQIAQSVTLSLLVDRANLHLNDLAPRYSLASGGDDLALHIVDHDMGDEIRSSRSLSGGERFLVSLSLALALSSMGSHGGLAATLFIDEGFGALDARSLDVAVDALEALQAQGRTIGVISHVEAMKDRIPVQIRVTRKGAGASALSLCVLP